MMTDSSGNPAINKKMHPTPAQELKKIAKEERVDVADAKFAQLMDEKDTLRTFRDKFHYPKMKDLYKVDLSLVDGNDDCIYMASHSQGLCPKIINKFLDIQIDTWAKCGVQGHYNGPMQWPVCDEMLEPDLASIVGGREDEVTVMNGLTVNLHVLLLAFYRPTNQRYKILCEDKAFCSDRHAFESEVRFHGRKPEDTMINLKPREGEFALRTEDILETIEKEGDQIAVICFSGVQFYTGQFFDIPTITKAGQKKGCVVGWDVAHAIVNVPLYLHDWGVDFACWCSYKYLCGAPGSIGGIFVHEKHHKDNSDHLRGWWGFTLSTRFNMDDTMEPCVGARAYRISAPATFMCASLKSSFEILKKTNVEKLRAKSLLLSGYMEYLINKFYGRPENVGSAAEEEATNVYIDIVSPSDPSQRGAQLSLAFNVDIYKIHRELEKRGVVCDVRLSHVIRVAPHPLYCSFDDIFRFVGFLKEATVACTRDLATAS